MRGFANSLGDLVTIRSLHVRRYRSLGSVSLVGCGQLNVLIGKNNAGKSNILSTIDLLLEHLKRGAVAGPWATLRARDEFTNREQLPPIQIGVEFVLTEKTNRELRERLSKEAPQLENAIAQIQGSPSLSIIICCATERGRPFIFTERMGVGSIDASGQTLGLTGITLLKVDRPTGRELFHQYDSTEALQGDLTAVRELASRGEVRFAFDANEENPARRALMIEQLLRVQTRSPGVRQRIDQSARSAQTLEEFRTAISQIAAEIQAKIQKSQKQETESVIATFAGDAKTIPTYVTWLMQQYGQIPVLHLRETKRPIGRAEADALLKLKVKRGGPARLDSIQQTVQALLGVNIDAFEAETTPRTESSAEMDIDEFLVDANGAGIREALRLILDLELAPPAVAMIEEPEVHLHPGLERAVETYLRERSRFVQMFVTTHSTHFVDSASFQNVYLVSRDKERRTQVEAVGADDGAFKIPAELGLRLSSLFMFEQLVFVEGPSDEAVLRELAKTLGVDFAKANAGFVQMSGIRSFAHFAAEQTLELLARRQMRLWFLVDRDEADDDEVARMVARLGDRATLHVLGRRELENFLLAPLAVQAFILEKRAAAGNPAPDEVKLDDVATSLKLEAEALRDEVLRLRLERRVLRPIYLQNRTIAPGLPEERIRLALNDLQNRLETLPAEREKATASLQDDWPVRAQELAPGSEILKKVATAFGSHFRKEIGDSAKIAKHLRPEDIPAELRNLLNDISRGGRN